MHKTVAELAEQYKPAPLPAKTAATKRKSVGATDGSPKKKKRKSEKAPGEGEADANGVELNEDGTPVEKPKRKRPPRPKKKKVAENGDGQATGSAEPAPASGSGNALLNLPPGEAARRNEMASQLLKGAGLDPATLSQEQFNIFANQSPDLQRESLNMLVKYGAERLRIVHPGNKADSTPAPATPARAANGTSATPQSDSAAETPDTSGKKKRSRKKKSDAVVDEDVSMADATPPATASGRKPRVTRGKCEGCKARKMPVSLPLSSIQLVYHLTTRLVLQGTAELPGVSPCRH